MTVPSEAPVSAIPGHDNGHVHPHGFRVPAWVTWSIVGFGVGIIVWAVIDSYLTERAAVEIRELVRLDGKSAHRADRIRRGLPPLEEPLLGDYSANGSKTVSDETASDPVL